MVSNLIFSKRPEYYLKLSENREFSAKVELKRVRQGFLLVRKWY